MVCVLIVKVELCNLSQARSPAIASEKSTFNYNMKEVEEILKQNSTKLSIMVKTRLKRTSCFATWYDVAAAILTPKWEMYFVSEIHTYMGETYVL